MANSIAGAQCSAQADKFKRYNVPVWTNYARGTVTGHASSVAAIELYPELARGITGFTQAIPVNRNPM